MTGKQRSCQFVACLATAALACSALTCASGRSSDTQPSAAASKRASPKDSQSVEDRTLIAVSRAIRQAHLTNLRDECLAYRFDAAAFKDAYLVEVSENHRHASCGGDPATQPRLFSVKVDKKTRAMFTDRGSPGEFHLLPR